MIIRLKDGFSVKIYFFKIWSMYGETFLWRKTTVRYIENRKILTVAITVSITNMIFMLKLFVFCFLKWPRAAAGESLKNFLA